MKKAKFLSILLVILSLSALFSCGKTQPPSELWKDAIYQSDQALGSGKQVFSLCVEAGEKSVRFDISTDEKTVGSALLSLGLIEGESGQFGLYVKKVNGILADYDVNSAYWAFYVGDEMSAVGVDQAEIQSGGNYRLVYTK